MKTIQDPDTVPAKGWRPHENVASLASVVTLVGGIPLLIAMAPKGWDGLAWILLGIPACVALSLLLGVTGWVAKERAAPWVTSSIVAVVMLFFTAIKFG
jgi:hypothetical protein